MSKSEKEKKRAGKARKGRSRTGSGPALIILSAVIWAGLTIAAALFVGPSFFDARANMTQIQKITGYTKAMNSMTDEKAEKQKAEAAEYNEQIKEEQEEDLFRYRGEAATDDVYEQQLSEDESGVMGYLEIPKLKLYLPISHGTKSDELEYECGHMYGTSLPIGGESTHAVIAGHTGLPTADLFTHLTDLEAGDEFRIHVLGEIHAYEVRNIYVVLPEEEAGYLQVEDGQDMVTLYTCTPYGINDHRLLVQGERTLPDPKAEKAGKTETMIVEQRNREAILKTGVYASIPCSVALLGILQTIRMILKRREDEASKKRRRRKRTNHSPGRNRNGDATGIQAVSAGLAAADGRRIHYGRGFTWDGTYERRRR